MYYNNAQIRELLEDFVARTVSFYENIADQPVVPTVDSETVMRVKASSVPKEGRDAAEVYEEMLRDVYSSSSLAQHPRSFSCVPSNLSLLSWMGDVMTNAVNPHASCKMNAPTVDRVEKNLVNWMCSLAGYPHSSGGLFVSGGSIANLTALTAARDAKLTFNERTNAVIYVSDQTHSSVAKGLHIIGFANSQIHTVATDEGFRMDVDALSSAVKQDIAEGKKPFAVVASAGTTNTGSVDPLNAIADICESYGMWMHVDGAYGASALLSETHSRELAGIERSDSLSWDAHKWMAQTYGCSVVLVRDRKTLVNSFDAHPEYLKDAEASPNSIEFWDLGPELTRPARGLKLWITLQVLGSDEMGRIFDHGCGMAEFAERTVRSLPGWEIVSTAKLGIVNFRYAPSDISSEAERDAINHRAAAELTRSGFAQVFTTELHGHKVIRLCTINPRTTEEDIKETVKRLDALCRE